MRNSLKYALKLVFLKCIFEFMINTGPPAQTASMAEKNCFDVTKLIIQIMCVTVVPWSRSFLHVQINRFRLQATLQAFCFFAQFFFSCLVYFFNTIFPFGLFFFILTADPAGHSLGSIYILSLSPEFYFGKGISKALDLHTGQAYDQIKTISCRDMSLL